MRIKEDRSVNEERIYVAGKLIFKRKFSVQLKAIRSSNNADPDVKVRNMN